MQGTGMGHWQSSAPGLGRQGWLVCYSLQILVFGNSTISHPVVRATLWRCAPNFHSCPEASLTGGKVSGIEPTAGAGAGHGHERCALDTARTLLPPTRPSVRWPPTEHARVLSWVLLRMPAAGACPSPLKLSFGLSCGRMHCAGSSFADDNIVRVARSSHVPIAECFHAIRECVHSAVHVPAFNPGCHLRYPCRYDTTHPQWSYRHACGATCGLQPGRSGLSQPSRSAGVYFVSCRCPLGSANVGRRVDRSFQWWLPRGAPCDGRDTTWWRYMHGRLEDVGRASDHPITCHTDAALHAPGARPSDRPHGQCGSTPLADVLVGIAGQTMALVASPGPVLRRCTRRADARCWRRSHVIRMYMWASAVHAYVTTSFSFRGKETLRGRHIIILFWRVLTKLSLGRRCSL